MHPSLPVTGGTARRRPSSLPVDQAEPRANVTEGVGHACMPGGGAGHLRRVVGDYHPVEAVLLVPAQRGEHVDVSFVDERPPWYSGT